MKPAEPLSESLSRMGRDQLRRGFWLRTMIQWHWISSALCLAGMFLFAITGITLNHAGQISAEPEIVSLEGELPADLRVQLENSTVEGPAPLPPDLANWLSQQFSQSIGVRPATWGEYEIYLSMPSPGVDAWVAIDRETGEYEFERTNRGWVAYFNDLHKGRNTGAGWKWFLDLFAIATLVFCVTGLFLLYVHARQRKMTWPLVGLGLIGPLLLAILLVH